METSKFKVVYFILALFITFSGSSFGVFSATLEKLFLPSVGPETSVFDIFGRGPYTGVTDGRILRYNRLRNVFDFYAVTAPNRPTQLCNGRNDSLLASTCGRPLGMAFHKLTNLLYVADASLGLFVVLPGGGQGILLANSANGTPFRFTDAIDVDQRTGIIYFTDGSSAGGINDIPALIASHDSTGRLLKYDPRTRQVTVLVSGLSGPAGLAVSGDSSYLIFSEYISMRIQKYWLTGPKANTAEIILNITGNPDNVRRTSSGDFWIAVTVTPGVQFSGIKIDGFGNVLRNLSFSPQFQGPTFITDVQEYGDALLLGSLDGPYLGVYRP